MLELCGGFAIERGKGDVPALRSVGDAIEVPLPLRPTPVQALPGDGFGYDCMTGEKQWQWYFDRIPN